MKALVFRGPGQPVWEDVPDPGIEEATDAIIRVDAVTICDPESAERPSIPSGTG